MYKIYRLKQKTRSVPPGGGGNGGKKNPKDPYVKRSELRAELKALENRIDVKLDAFKKETRKEFAKTKKEIAETKKEIASVKIEMNSKFDKVNTKFDEVNSILKLILKKLNIK